MKLLIYLVLLAAVAPKLSSQVDYVPYIAGAPVLVTRVFACSADGQTLVGFVHDIDGWNKPIRWTKSGGMLKLDLISTGLTAAAWDCSDDGLVVVGEVSPGGAFRWENGVMETLPSLPGGPTLTEGAIGISPDSATSVGATYSSNGQEATIWPKGSAPYGLFNVHSKIKPYGAHKYTSQGVIVGIASVSGGNEAYVYKSGVIQTLGDLPGGDHYSYAHNTTPDGSTVVGYSMTGAPRAFYWTERTGMVDLGIFPGAPTFSFYESRGITYDGWRVVGHGKLNTNTGCSGNSSLRAFVWDPIMGMQVLQDIVEEEQGAPLGTHILITAFDCSADGTYVVGEALKLSNCAREGYRAKIKPFCYADCDQSPGHKRTLDAFDFLCFIARFDQQDFYTDCDQNGEHDFFDLLCYINEFGKGCEP